MFHRVNGSGTWLAPPATEFAIPGRLKGFSETDCFGSAQVSKQFSKGACVAGNGGLAIANPSPSLGYNNSPKILLYSHDTTGLGNIRRTILIAEAMAAEWPDAAILIVTGSPMIHGFRIRHGIDYIKLPCLDRVAAETYRPTYLNGHGKEVSETRRDLIRMTVDRFDPDLMIVDKRATGIDGELLDALEALKGRRSRVRLVLGIRDILDEPKRTRASLRSTGAFRAMERFYDEVWIYGARTVFDTVKEYGFPRSVSDRTHYCGYLQRPVKSAGPRVGMPRVLVTPGGGADGGDLITNYLEGLAKNPPAQPVMSTIVFGPQLPEPRRESIIAKYRRLPNMQFHDFDPHLERHYANSDLVIAMAGYNTVCELLSFRLRAVLVPRAEPVREQLIRARRFSELGYFTVIEPRELTPARMMDAMSSAIAAPRPQPNMDLGGLSWILRRARDLCATAVV